MLCCLGQTLVARKNLSPSSGLSCNEDVPVTAVSREGLQKCGGGLWVGNHQAEGEERVKLDSKTKVGLR